MIGKVFVFLADGFEEIEALTTIDTLRRAGLDVEIVSVTPCRDPYSYSIDREFKNDHRSTPHRSGSGHYVP